MLNNYSIKWPGQSTAVEHSKNTAETGPGFLSYLSQADVTSFPFFY